MSVGPFSTSATDDSNCEDRAGNGVEAEELNADWDGARVDEWEGCGEIGGTGWKRQIVVSALNRGVEDVATAYACRTSQSAVYDRQGHNNAP